MRRLAALTFLPLLLCACGGRDAVPSAEMEIRAGNRSEVEELDPHLVTGSAEFRALTALFEGLTSVDPATLEPIPGVAQRWEISEDGRRYTFHLRDNARFSNGEPVTAGDFVFSWKRMLSPALAAEYAYMLHVIQNARAYNEGTLTDFSQVGVKALDDRTLEVTLENPTPYFLSMQVNFMWFPLHRPTLEKFGAEETRGTKWTQPGNHVGNGPFMLEEWYPNEHLRFVRNPHYWNAAEVKPDAVKLYPVSNEQTEERSFRAGELHMTYSIPIHRIEAYRKEQPEVLNLKPYLQTYYYRFNTTRPPFDDVRVRRAFGLAIDREAIARNVLKAGEQPAYHFTPPQIAGYNAMHRVSQDAAAARLLLAEAGYPEGKGFPAVTLLYNTAEYDKTVSEALQRMWQQALGVQVQLLHQDYKTYLASMSSLDYDIARSTWAADFVDPINFLECFLSGQGNNRTGYNNPEYDALIHAAYAEADAAKREAHLQEAERMLLEDAPVTPLCITTLKFLLSPQLKGVKPNPIAYFRWQDFYLEPAG